ncbi:DNA double-strand break repair nuclease NurA, partial [Candidatus Micrarchaeota archaeon]|nr:DNA double-strand break repair nuclease NurA [Candidatus Micrarchaeota archaeon]
MGEEERIKKIVEEIRELESKQRSVCEHLRRDGFEWNEPEMLERTVITKIAEEKTDGRIIGIDGGMLSEELHGLDLLLVRGCAVIFDYKKGKLTGYDYFPSRFPPYEIFVKYSLENYEFAWAKSILRLRNEISTAVEALKKFSPKAILLDGSIIPQAADKPSKDSEVFLEYQNLLKRYAELYSMAEEKNCLITGVIKDSRGKQFLDILSRQLRRGPFEREFHEISARTNDTTFLSSLLSEGERTFAFRYSRECREHPILRDFREWAERICSLYLKPVPFDRPLRVDFLNTASEKEPKEQLIQRISS